MADFYAEMALMAESLLTHSSQGGLGQGVIQLSVTTVAAPNPADPFAIPVSTTQTETLKGAVRGIGKELVGKEVNGTVIIGSDRQAICTVPKINYTAGASLVIDGKPVHIIAIQRIPEAGITSIVRFIIRG